MLTSLFAFALGAASLGAHPDPLPATEVAEAAERDTLVQVDPGTRVVIQSHEGSVVVRGWGRSAVEVVAAEDEELRVGVSRTAGTLTIHAGGRWGEPADADLTVNVPAGSPIKIHAPFADVDIEGVDREVTVQTVEGGIRLAGGSDVITLHTVEGDVEVRGASGRIEVNTVDGDIRLTDVSGDVSLNTVDGDVRLDGVASSNVKAAAVDGDVVYRGDLRPNGVYRLSTHDGDLYVTVPETAGAVVSIATWGGEFSASFPIAWEGRRDGKRMEFTIGNGGARLELQAFEGEIRLLRPGERVPGHP